MVASARTRQRTRQRAGPSAPGPPARRRRAAPRSAYLAGRRSLRSGPRFRLLRLRPRSDVGDRCWRAARAPTPALPTRAPTTPDRIDRARELAATAEAGVTEAQRLARADVALVRELMDRIKRTFFELGEVLSRLKQPAAFASLGYSSFQELCKVELGISVTKANELIAIATNMSPALARALGQKNALAVVTLCKATPEDDTPEQLVGRRIPLPSGKVLDVDRSSTREKREARRSSCRARGKGRARPRCKSAPWPPTLRGSCAQGLERATVQALATRSGQPSDLTIDGVPVPALSTICTALCGRPAPKKRRR